MLREHVDSLDAIVRASTDLESLRTLLQNREKYYKETHKELTEWLLEGSLILNRVGYITLFSPLESKPLPAVVKMSSNIPGICVAGGDQCVIPSEYHLCPYCGKSFTLQDVYAHNFHFDSGTFFHSDECTKFHYKFILAEELVKNMILICKRCLGTIENVCIQQGSSGEFIKMSCLALGYKIEITLFDERGISITYSKNGTTSIIFKSENYCDSSLSIVSDELYHWMKSL